ncbi:MAG: SDR family oxidoreductase [bacterium]|nr:SDR family oxidoreductase [bacterium]
MGKLAFVTKVRPGSISDAIKNKLLELGYEVIVPEENWDIREGYPFPLDCKVLVNTAGVTDTAEADEWDWDKTDRIISTNLTGAIKLTSDFIRDTSRTEGTKTIIHLGSLWSRKHATNGAAYCASKAGLAHFVACIGYDAKLKFGDEFVVVGLHPGNVDGTPLTRRVKAQLRNERGFTLEQVEDLYRGTITPTEIADVVAKVLGCKWLNGENIYLANGDKR